jgi:hypothetical protein
MGHAYRVSAQDKPLEAAERQEVLMKGGSFDAN